MIGDLKTLKTENNLMNQTEITQIIDDNIKARRSIRAFLPNEIPEQVILDLLAVAARAPSGTNTQPWQVYVVTGAKKKAISDDIMKAFMDPVSVKEHEEEYSYYPAKWIDPYLSRRRKVGFDLYGLLGLGKDDKDKMQAQHARNYQFFDAPVGIFFTIDRVMQQGSWLDYGMFIQSVMLAAKARGLDTCPQAAFTQFHKIIAKHLDLKPEQQLVCGMSLGFADNSKIENTLVTEREPAKNFTHFLK
jgi:nitroreductase